MTVRETDDAKQNPRENKRNWNNLMSQRLGNDFKMTNKACYTCGSFKHLHYVCDKKVARHAWNNSRRVNHKNFSNKMSHPYPKRSFVPQAILTRSRKLSTASAAVNTIRSVNTANTKVVNTTRPVNTAASKQTVNHPRPLNNTFKRGYSQSSRPFNRYFANKNSITKTNVNIVSVKHTTARDRAVVRNKGKGANVVKALACWDNPQQKEYKEKTGIDSGCSRHMTRNKCYLDEYEDYDGGLVSFGDGKGRISGKGCLVAILNTRDHLGKFDGKADEGYFVGIQSNTVAGPKDRERNTRIKPIEVDENEASDISVKDDEATRSKLERLNQREMQTENTNNTNGINTVSTPISTTRPTVDTTVPSPPVNTIRPSVDNANAFEEHLFERFSPFKNAFSLPPVLNILQWDLY
ncbi:hypothetical protein Tco_0980501 [Tanacetum coccineum]